MNDTHTIRLIRRIGQGDKDAFQALYNRYFWRVFRFSLSLIKNEVEAEEITQDVFYKVWSSRSKLDVDQSLNGYIFKIAKNLTLNKLRKRRGEPVNFSELPLNLSVNKTEEDVFLSETEVLLQNAIEALPPKRQQIFRLSRIEGLSNKEIADQLEISVNTVEGQIRKALQYMRSYIDYTLIVVWYWF